MRQAWSTSSAPGGIVLTYDPDGRILCAGGQDAPAVTIGKHR